MIEQTFAVAVRRDPEPKMRWVMLTDGQEDLLRQVDAPIRKGTRWLNVLKTLIASRLIDPVSEWRYAPSVVRSQCPA